MSHPRSIRIMCPRTREYLGVVVNANAPLDNTPAAISLDEQTTWMDAEWVDVPPNDVLPEDAAWTFSRMARVLLGDTNPLPTKNVSRVLIAFDDNPERPVMEAGKLVID